MSVLKRIFSWVNNEAKRNKESKFIILFKMLLNYLKYGVNPKEYYYFDFGNKTPEQKKTFFTRKMFRQFLKRNNNPAFVQILNDKYIFSKTFSEFLGRKVVRSNSFLKNSELEYLFEDAEKIVYKPYDGSGGNGIKVIKKSDYPDLSKLAEELRSMPEAVLEQYIPQHEEISKAYPYGVNCLRIATLYRDGKCNFLGGLFTLGINKGEVVNALQHSVFGLINMETGEVYTDLCDYSDNLFSKHPDTGFVAKGYKIPFWKELLEMVEKASAVVPQVGYVGWDVAISETGPVLIEGNSLSAGYIGYQHYLLRDDRQGSFGVWGPFIK